MDRRQVDNFGINNELPQNPFIFILPKGKHHAFPDIDVLITHPDTVLKFDGQQHLIHNEKGVYHEVQYKAKTRELFLFDRRTDLEAHNQPRAVTDTVSTSKKAFGRLRQASSRPASPAPSAEPLFLTPPDEGQALSPLQLLYQNFMSAGEPPKTPSLASTPTDPLDATICNAPVQTTTNPLPSSSH